MLPARLRSSSRPLASFLASAAAFSAASIATTIRASASRAQAPIATRPASALASSGNRSGRNPAATATTAAPIPIALPSTSIGKRRPRNSVSTPVR
ncbi:hypothetical protein GCM10025880_31230 [Methylorubrum aminovorans]|nr:hypothetical protein GCM10025880_31230 [Methylorubrum aminovorans]